MSRPRTPRRQFLSPTGTRATPMRNLDTHPLAEYDDDRRVETERIAAATSIRDEPEMVSGAWLEDWAEVALLHQSQQHAHDVAEMQHVRPTLDPEHRLADIQRRAKHSHVNLTRECMIMGAEIKRARTGNRTIPGRVLRRMETVEALLDGLT